MGGRVLGPDLAKGILDAFMKAEFEGGRHQNRIDKIHALEK
ncbi:MAG: RpiB/LacA/LacB family sugar-phosphate isomerase, partial [Clostridia bacterium]|nr:RpiB/LacA/LacB family sugar-phosphate isomerase [Clostridia bacterium]